MWKTIFSGQSSPAVYMCFVSLLLQCLFAVSSVTQLLLCLRCFAQSTGEIALQCNRTSTATIN